MSRGGGRQEREPENCDTFTYRVDHKGVCSTGKSFLPAEKERERVRERERDTQEKENVKCVSLAQECSCHLSASCFVFALGESERATGCPYLATWALL